MRRKLNIKIKTLKVGDYMNFLFDPLEDMVIEMIKFMLGHISISNFATGELSLTPQNWNNSVYEFIKRISNEVILPIGGLILTYIMCHELITMIIDKNNMSDFSGNDIFKWIFKTMISIMVLANMFSIIEAIFVLSAELVNGVSNITYSSSSPNINNAINELQNTLDSENLATLCIILIEVGLMYLGMFVINTFILPLILAARMFYIYILLVLSPIPFASFGNRAFSSIGQSYVKTLSGTALQAVLMQVCVALYEILIGTAFSGSSSSPIITIGLYFIYGVLLVGMLWRSGSIAKSIFGVS